MIDSLQARQAADAQALRLAPHVVAPDFLAEAIWHRTLAEGSAPSDAEVLDYLARCAADRVPISGRQEHEPAIHPVETYRVGGLAIEVRRSRGAGRRQYVATVVGPRTYVAGHRTLAGIHRAVERLHPGGTWSCSLSTRDLSRIRERWGEPVRAPESERPR